ncbi:CDP-glycerol glycerophosphotransferase family protein [Pullulanibacillus sp. KACC 23026]|uniref:CDP-glycerol glycerophosphotransferase family protein n=1 Tax=Pullulanibacillus sp. KACC 23026 TaxID=3028315 RepID=UPI0023AE85D9|nr:CDP-glycerol glycerophosphotransferase family protein [Pullulanibacillus sp. KACC 23026]WEG11509.1 CDP-glycerol glycerophosphotransferase family protein [Pullulanibacillus sp. KACC 23026]
MSQWVLNFKGLCIFVLTFLLRILPIKSNKIIFFSYYGSQYGGNPKYLSEYILKNVSKDSFEIVWSFVHPNEKRAFSDYRLVRWLSLRFFYELSTSKVIVTDYRTLPIIRKRKNQYYIQTWHSSLRLKQIEKDAIDHLTTHYVKMAKKDSSKCDLLLSGCQESTTIFRRSFWYQGPIFEKGTPRNDVFFQKDIKKSEWIKAKLQIPKSHRVVTYAPTFRTNGGLDLYRLDFNAIRKKLEAEYGGDWTFLVRLHPHLLSQSQAFFMGQKVLDVTHYDDPQDILYVTDLLITDYSSLMFDFALTKRPCFLYLPDLETYMRNERELYFSIDELPFLKAFSQEELMEQIGQFKRVAYLKRINQFLEKVGSYETGHASEALVLHIQNICFGERATRSSS